VLDLPDEWLRQSTTSSPPFPVFVPRGFAAKMRPGDPTDPLLRQVLPLVEEALAKPGFTKDPVDDSAALLTAGLLQKYHGRVLLVLTGACAIHCRYCFRQFFPYHAGPVPSERRRAILAAIAEDPTIEEVILSGGDPLTLPDTQLAEWVEELAVRANLMRRWGRHCLV
jgi:L-lysine 2,3-aminomutase